MFLNASPSYTLHRHMLTLLTSPLLCAVWPGLQGFFMKGFVVWFFFFSFCIGVELCHCTSSSPLPFCFYLRVYLFSSRQGKRADFLHPFLCQPFSPEEEGSSDDPVLCSAGGDLCFSSCHPGLEGDGRKNPRLWRFGKDAEAHLCSPPCAELPVVVTVLTSTAITGTSSWEQLSWVTG